MASLGWPAVIGTQHQERGNNVDLKRLNLRKLMGSQSYESEEEDDDDLEQELNVALGKDSDGEDSDGEGDDSNGKNEFLIEAVR
jgi:hypothetical protein